MEVYIVSGLSEETEETEETEIKLFSTLEKALEYIVSYYINTRRTQKKDGVWSSDFSDFSTWMGFSNCNQQIIKCYLNEPQKNTELYEKSDIYNIVLGENFPHLKAKLHLLDEEFYSITKN